MLTVAQKKKVIKFIAHYNSFDSRLKSCLISVPTKLDHEFGIRLAFAFLM